MASFLPRGVPSAQDDGPSGELQSPSEDLNVTLRKLLDTNARLLEKIAELEGDKMHFQNKLEEYIRYDREEGGSHEKVVSRLERQISELLAEKADLQSMLVKKDTDIGDLSSSQQLRLSERGHRAHLLQRLNELQASSELSHEKYARQVEVLKLDNSRLREEVGMLRKTLDVSDHKIRGKSRPPSWELVRPYQHLYSSTEGYSSLPESLQSHAAGITEHYREAESSTGLCRGAEIPNIAALRLTSDPSPLSTELKKLKKQLEKYKTANIELDQKLKDANLELQKHKEHRCGTDVGYRMDLERLRSENNKLRVQLDRALSECNHFRSLVGRRY